MIKLNLEKLKKYKKPILNAFPSNSTVKKHRYFYVDFEKSLIKALNSTNYIEVGFEYEVEEDIDIVNFYVDLHKLFYILKEDTINLKFLGENKTPVFYDSNGEYAISFEPNDKEGFNLPYDIRNGEGVDQTFTLSEDDKKIISEASQFFPPTLDEFNSLIIQNKSIFCITRSHMYTNSISVDLEENVQIGLHKNVVKTLLLIKEDFNLKTISGEKNPIVAINEDILFVLEENVLFMLPSEEDLKTLYPTDSYVRLKKEEAIETLAFFDPFYIKDSKPVDLRMKEEGVLELSVSSSFDVVKKEVALEDFTDDLEDFEVQYNGSTLKDMINLIQGEDVIFYLSNNHIGVLVTEEGTDRKAILVRYKKSNS